MRERSYAAGAVHDVDLGVGEEVGAEVAVAEHDAFGHAGGAAGVDHGHPLVGLDFAFAALDFGHPFVAVGDAEFEYFEGAVLAFDVGEGVDLGVGFELVEGRAEAVEEHFGADKYRGGLAVAEDVEVGVGVEGGVDGDVDDAAHGESHVDEVPFGAVAAHGDDAVALFEAHFAEAVGEVVSEFVVVVRAIFYPFAVDFSGEDVVFRMLLHQVVEQIKSACDFYHVLFCFKMQKYEKWLTWQNYFFNRGCSGGAEWGFEWFGR